MVHGEMDEAEMGGLDSCQRLAGSRLRGEVIVSLP